MSTCTTAARQLSQHYMPPARPWKHSLVLRGDGRGSDFPRSCADAYRDAGMLGTQNKHKEPGLPPVSSQRPRRLPFHHEPKPPRFPTPAQAGCYPHTVPITAPRGCPDAPRSPPDLGHQRGFRAGSGGGARCSGDSEGRVGVPAAPLLTSVSMGSTSMPFHSSSKWAIGMLGDACREPGRGKKKKIK